MLPYRGRKYLNKVVVTEDGRFDSMKEYRRFKELKLMEDMGEIEDLECQVKFTLITGKRWSDGKKHRDTVYIADFVYHTKEGEKVVEDVKGFKTPVYKLKKELMKDVYGIEIQEV